MIAQGIDAKKYQLLLIKKAVGTRLYSCLLYTSLALARKINQVKCWMDNLEVDSVIYQPAVNKSWHPLYGERSTVREAYNEATMYLSKKDGSHYRLNIEVRAYDEGIAFRYFFPEHPQAIFHKVVGDLRCV